MDFSHLAKQNRIHAAREQSPSDGSFGISFCIGWTKSVRHKIFFRATPSIACKRTAQRTNTNARAIVCARDNGQEILHAKPICTFMRRVACVCVYARRSSASTWSPQTPCTERKIQPIRSSAYVGVATTTSKLFGRSFAHCVSRACGSNEGESLQFDFLFCVGTSSQTHISRSSSSNRSSRVAAQQQQRRATEERENSLSFEVFWFLCFSLHCWQCVCIYVCSSHRDRRSVSGTVQQSSQRHRGSEKFVVKIDARRGDEKSENLIIITLSAPEKEAERDRIK